MTTTEQIAAFEDVPGPQGSGVAGVAPEFLRDPISVLARAHRDHGDLVAFPFGPRKGPLGKVVVAAYHPDAARQVLTETERTIGRGPSSTQVLDDMIGRNLMTTDGAEWRRQRRTLQPLFTPKRVAQYTDLMAAEAARIVAEDVPAGTAADRVDLHRLMLRYSLRVVGRALFSGDIDYTAPELHKLIPLTNELIIGRTTQLLKPPLALPTPRNRAFLRTKAQLYALIDRILARSDAEAGGAERDDIVTRLRTARDPETGAGLSDAEIRDQTLLMMMAGHETTATALTFALHLLGRHGEVQQTVADEALAYTRGGGTPAEFAQQRETLARASLLESMRLYPPVYMTEHLATADIVLGGYRVPAGTAVFLSPWVTHRHPEFWPEPERFDPHRFVGEHDRPRYAYLPFGGGPHVCIGEHFALLAATVLLEAVLRAFRIESLAESVSFQQTGNLRPDEPVWARLTAR
ncbi:cytochrome P450 [Streptomyces lunalinharesii]|uniref:Cytochrome P450 n=1 Tax=Streptomyces lunalinharesii TaxID=333384 RepID=A0ABN3REB1_9ACTN